MGGATVSGSRIEGCILRASTGSHGAEGAERARFQLRSEREVSWGMAGMNQLGDESAGEVR